MPMFCIALCDINNGGCTNARCELDSYGEPICHCEKGFTMLTSNDECAEDCAAGYHMDLQTGDCDSMYPKLL